MQHFAGSGKSNSIACVAHQLIGLSRDDAPAFDIIIVVTDRVIHDRQIRDKISQYALVGATVGRAEGSGDLRRLIESGRGSSSPRFGGSPFTLSFGSKVRYRVAVAKPRVYVETSIPRFYVERRTAPDVVARRKWTRQWWADAPKRYELVTSTAVLDELTGDVPKRSAQRLALVHGPAFGRRIGYCRDRAGIHPAQGDGCRSQW